MKMAILFGTEICDTPTYTLMCMHINVPAGKVLKFFNQTIGCVQMIVNGFEDIDSVFVTSSFLNTAESTCSIKTTKYIP